MTPRKNPVTKKTFGVNVLTNFAYHYVHAKHRDGTPYTGNVSTVTVYEVFGGGKVNDHYAVPLYQVMGLQPHGVRKQAGQE